MNDTSKELFKVTLSLSFPESEHGGTRALYGVDDSKVSYVDFFIFSSSSGKLLDGGYIRLTDGSQSGVLQFSTDVSRSVVCCAVVNRSTSDLSSISSLSELEDTSSYLNRQKPNCLEMYGKTGVMTLGRDELITIKVDRIAAKVSLDGIKVNLEQNNLASKSFTVNAVYMINVVPSLKLDGSGRPSPSTWLNNRTNTCNSSTSYGSLIWNSINVTHTSANGSYLGSPLWFYVYPNSVTSDNPGGTATSSRYTRLVVDTSLGYYSVSLPQLQANTWYQIKNITIKGKGSTNPDVLVERGACSVSVEVKDWSGTHIVNETY